MLSFGMFIFVYFHLFAWFQYNIVFWIHHLKVLFRMGFGTNSKFYYFITILNYLNPPGLIFLVEISKGDFTIFLKKSWFFWPKIKNVQNLFGPSHGYNIKQHSNFLEIVSSYENLHEIYNFLMTYFLFTPTYTLCLIM